MKTLTRLLLIAGLLLALTAALQAQSSPTGVNAGNATGIQPYNSYGGVRENINLANGNLNLQIPLLTLPGRNGHDLGIGLEYDSKIWQLHSEFIMETGEWWYWWDVEYRLPAAGYVGWRLSLPSIQSSDGQFGIMNPTFCTMNFVVTLADGSKHPFGNRNNCTDSNGSPRPSSNVPISDSEDASFMRLDTSTSEAVVHLKDGTRIHFAGGSSVPVVASKIVDPDGNVITITQTGGLVSKITDTVGREVTFTWTAQLSSISYKDSSGTTRTISLTYTNRILAPDFQSPIEAFDPAPITVPLLSSITLPNGLSYTFEYDNNQSTNTYGELTKIKYPTGGYTRYDYGRFTADIADFREVVARRVCRNSSGSCGTEDVTTYTPTINALANEYM
ncbi:MAG: hypothetical protein ACREQA_04320, partial [Candidatus Binatia bacterium]